MVVTIQIRRVKRDPLCRRRDVWRTSLNVKETARPQSGIEPAVTLDHKPRDDGGLVFELTSRAMGWALDKEEWIYMGFIISKMFESQSFRPDIPEICLADK